VTPICPDLHWTLASNEDVLIFACGKSRLRIAFHSPSIARITFTEDKPFQTLPSLMVTSTERFSDYEITETATAFTIMTRQILLQICKKTAAIEYFDRHGSLLLREPTKGGKHLKKRSITRNVFHGEAGISAGQSIDGARAQAGEFETVFDRDGFEARLDFEFAPQEALFGLGSHEEGYGNLRGKSRHLYQQNMKMVVPHLVSSKGYSLLWDCGSLMKFHDDPNGSFWWADAVDELDYYFIYGGSFDGVTRCYHQLTGAAPLLPKWAFGFIQSKERYVHATELLDLVREYRRRNIPLDGVVLDWKSWPNGAGWGQKSFDPERFPDPSAWTQELHDMGAHLMVSIWPIMTGSCPNQVEMLENGCMLGNQSTYNAFDPAASALYWNQANRGLFRHGVDAWWCDCTEPFEADWSGAEKPDPEKRLLMNTEAAATYLDRTQINTYSLPHSQGIYVGQRSVTSAKRVLNLTRSSYAGQHRYGTVCWNGDICATWETLRACIPEGVNFCATGEPWWTVDIGGFFINHDPNYWFWRGDYSEGCRGLTPMEALQPDPNDTGCRDLGFHELYTRWMQYAVFLPMFRSHGTDAAREIWRFGEPGNPFYDAIATAIRLRYQLLPYLYTIASEVTREGRMMLRALALDFPNDPATHAIDDQFLCGRSLLICPVTHPMLYGPNSEPILDAPRTRSVYLPADTCWYDFHTGRCHQGGQTIMTTPPLDSIPVFVRAGSIIPLGPVLQTTSEASSEPIELRVYPGRNAELNLYDDEGDGYGYETGEFTLTPIHWDDSTAQLTIGEPQGDFPGRKAIQTFRTVIL
jgi:alpha-D-xyloside xylohydrolase